MQALEQELKQLIIDTLDLEDMSVADIDSNEALFVEGLGLDSIDALELGLALQKQYGVKLDAESEATRQHFKSVATLAAAVEVLADTCIRLTIEEGKYHQVKRMLAAVGNKVVALHREKIGSVLLDEGLTEGEFRALTPTEVADF